MRSTEILVRSLVGLLLPLFSVVDRETSNGLMAAAEELIMLSRLLIVHPVRPFGSICACSCWGKAFYSSRPVCLRMESWKIDTQAWSCIMPWLRPRESMVLQGSRILRSTPPVHKSDGGHLRRATTLNLGILDKINLFAILWNSFSLPTVRKQFNKPLRPKLCPWQALLCQRL